MTCTFCGSLLDGNETECPYCGHKVDNDEPVSPSQKYNDHDYESEMESRFAADRGSTSEEYEYEEDEADYDDQEEYAADAGASTGKSRTLKLPDFSKKTSGSDSVAPRNPNVVLFGFVALCLLFSLIGMFVSISTLNKVKDMQQDITSQFYVLQSDIRNTLDEMQNNMTSSIRTATAPDPSGGVVRITHSPTSVDTVQVGVSEKLLFSCIAEGYDTLTFTWEKKSASGEWVAINFGPDSRCAPLGIMVYDQPYTKVSEDKFSQITAVDLTADAAGDYRCKVSDKDGHYAYSDVATLYL